MSTVPNSLPAVSEDEKSLAMLTCIVSPFFGFLGPLVVWQAKRDSKFVSFHAVQMLIFQLLFVVGFFVMFFSVLAPMVKERMRTAPPGPPTMPPEALLPILLAGLLNLVVGFVFAIKAKNGKWTRLPIIGHLARLAVGVANS